MGKGVSKTPEEHRIHQEFLSHSQANSKLSLCFIVGSLILGVLGYHLTEGLPWIDALLNASMILGGMGPVDPIRTTAGKLFASFYALFSGLLFLALVGLVVGPVFKRALHFFHNERGVGKE